MEPKDVSVKQMLEERRVELKRLLAGALRFHSAQRYDLDVTVRRKVDVFDPEAAIFLVKADVEPRLTAEQVAFIVSSIESRGFTVKRTEIKGERLLMLI